MSVTGNQAPYPWQERAWQRLIDYRAAERMPHGLLIAGPAGLGKLELAKRLAQAMACNAPAEQAPCGRCSACVQFAAGSWPDFHDITLEETDKGTLSRQIRIDQIRELTAELALSSRQGGWKTALIHPADAMNVNAANSLLKTLEEPPARSLLILVTSRPSSLLPTIRSRCQQIAVGLPPLGEAMSWLEQQSVKDARIALAQGGGAPLRALEISESGFVARRQELIEAIHAVARRKRSLVDAATEMEKTGPDAVVAWLETVIMDLVALRQLDEKTPKYNPDFAKFLKPMAEGLNLVAMHRYLDALRRARGLLERAAVNPLLLLESLLVPWAQGFDEKLIERLLEG